MPGAPVTLPLSGGGSLDLRHALDAGRAVLAAYGAAQRCDPGPGGELLKARVVYFDTFFGAGDDANGVMAMPFAEAYAPRPPAAGASPRSPGLASAAHGAAARDESRDKLLFFFGRTPKPYIGPPMSSLRARLLAALDRSGPHRDMVLGSVDWNLTVSPYVAGDASAVCARCSYDCKLCYAPESWADTRRDTQPPLPPDEYARKYETSRFTVVARGDSPLTAKLSEAMVGGSIPVVLIDSSVLPLQHEIDYDACCVRIDPEHALADPSSLMRRLRSLGAADEQRKRAYLRTVQHLAEYGRADRNGPEASIFRQLLATPPAPLAAEIFARRLAAVPTARRELARRLADHGAGHVDLV